MSTDFESEFYRIVADNFSPDDNLPAFPGHATPREWLMHERVSEETPVRPYHYPRDMPTGEPITDPRRLLTGPAVARLETHAASLDGSWVSPHTGRRYTVGEVIEPADYGDTPPAITQHNATYNHPGNPNPFRTYPARKPKPDDTEE